jgi:hypothetical protein
MFGVSVGIMTLVLTERAPNGNLRINPEALHALFPFWYDMPQPSSESDASNPPE